MELKINTGNDNGYNIIIKKDSLKEANKYFDLNRKVLIVSDELIPKEYIEVIKKQAKDAYVFTFKSGEAYKSLETIENILQALVNNKFTRTDCIIAIGGGITTDMAGFASSMYMRGIDFYSVPTTLLAQVDASIGGKTAVNFKGIKNNIGAFYFPKCVLIDPNTLKTLDDRLIAEGLAEAIKMSVTSNKELFNFIKNSNNLMNDIEHIIIESLKIKAKIVEEDPFEKNIRKILNFGHTIGHAIEMINTTFYHGECVSLGMTYMIDKKIRNELLEVLNKYNLPIKIDLNNEEIIDKIKLDKKASGNMISIIFVKEIGSYEIKKINIDELINYLNMEV